MAPTAHPKWPQLCIGAKAPVNFTIGVKLRWAGHPGPDYATQNKSGHGALFCLIKGQPGPGSRKRVGSGTGWFFLSVGIFLQFGAKLW